MSDYDIRKGYLRHQEVSSTRSAESREGFRLEGNSCLSLVTVLSSVLLNIGYQLLKYLRR